MANRYVDTAAAVGGDGTTAATTGATRAFNSLLDCINSLPNPLTQPIVIWCAASTGVADTQGIDQAPWDMVTSATNNLKITTNSSNRATMPHDTARYRLATVDSDALYNNVCEHVWFDGLQVQITATTSGVDNYVGFRLSNLNQTGATIDNKISNCVFKGIQSGTDNVFGYNNSLHAGTGTTKVWNCVAYGGYCGFTSDDTSIQYVNCTGYGNNFNFMDAMTCTNCLSAAPVAGDGFLGVTGGSYNASDDASAPGTNAQTLQVFSFVNAGNEDFHLQATDVGAKGLGLTDPLSGLFADDLDGVTRTGAWDIGADQVAAATVALTGTATGSITEADIVAGGKTIILTVTGDTFVPLSSIPTIGYISSALGGVADTTTTGVTLPGTVANDILLFIFCHRGTGNGTISGTSITTGGLTWTQKHDQLFGASAFSGKVLWTRASGNHSGQTVQAASLTNAAASVLVVLRNVLSSAAPFDGAATIVGEQNISGNETQAEITTLVDGCLVCLVVFNSPDVNVSTHACTSPGALIERAERLSTGGTDASVSFAAEVKATAGATGAFTWAQVNGASGSVAFALQPDAQTPFANARAAIISGIDSAQSEATGWDAKVKANIPVGNVVRTSATVATVTLHAQADYNITAQETITVTIPATALGSAAAVVATPTFTVSTSAAGSVVPVAMAGYRRRRN